MKRPNGGVIEVIRSQERRVEAAVGADEAGNESRDV
jgi:hypothetical protein